jgi:hypothetical protein
MQIWYRDDVGNDGRPQSVDVLATFGANRATSNSGKLQIRVAHVHVVALCQGLRVVELRFCGAECELKHNSGTIPNTAKDGKV